MTTETTVVVFANKTLPDSDYRLASRELLAQAGYRTVLALPGRPEGTRAADHRRLRVTEGFGWRDLLAPFHVLCILAPMRRRSTIAHFFSSKLYLVGPLVARLVGVPAVVTITGFGRAFDGVRPDRPVAHIYLLLLRLSTRASEMVLVQNTKDAEVIRRLIPAAAPKLRFVGSALDVKSTPPDREATRPGPPIALFVGRLLASKGVPDFLQLAQRHHGDWVFRMVGPASPGEPEVAASVAAAVADGVVEHLGELPPAETRAQYEAADVLVMPSFGEGLPRTLLEAGAARLPVLAYDINGTHDLLRDTPALVDLGDVDGLGTALRALRQDPELRARIGRDLHRRVMEDYTVTALAQRTIEVYDAVRDGLGRTPSDDADGVVPLRNADLDEVVDVQLAAFPGFKLTRMGRRFVRAYLSYFLDGRMPALAMGVRRQGELVGIALGATSTAGFYRRVRRRPWRLIGPTAVAVARDPSRFVYLLRSMSRVRSAGEEVDAVSGPEIDPAELSSLAVHPDRQAAGVGRDLLQAFTAEAFSRGVDRVRLTTDAVGNDRVNEFYRRAGFTLEGRWRDPGGRSLNGYVLERPVPR